MIKSPMKSMKGFRFKTFLLKNKKPIGLIIAGVITYISPFHPLIKAIEAPLIYLTTQALDFYLNEVELK